LNKVLFTGN